LDFDLCDACHALDVEIPVEYYYCGDKFEGKHDKTHPMKEVDIV
jgi:hypothetical protein